MPRDDRSQTMGDAQESLAGEFPVNRLLDLRVCLEIWNFSVILVSARNYSPTAAVASSIDVSYYPATKTPAYQERLYSTTTVSVIPPFFLKFDWTYILHQSASQAH